MIADSFWHAVFRGAGFAAGQCVYIYSSALEQPMPDGLANTKGLNPALDDGIVPAAQQTALGLQATRLFNELNADTLTPEDKIIANPNCSTIQLVVALNELHKAYRVQRIVVSTYQSVTGTGKKAVDQLLEERAGQTASQPIFVEVVRNFRRRGVGDARHHADRD